MLAFAGPLRPPICKRRPMETRCCISSSLKIAKELLVQLCPCNEVSSCLLEIPFPHCLSRTRPDQSIDSAGFELAIDWAIADSARPARKHACFVGSVSIARSNLKRFDCANAYTASRKNIFSSIDPTFVPNSKAADSSADSFHPARVLLDQTIQALAFMILLTEFRFESVLAR